MLHFHRKPTYFKDMEQITTLAPKTKEKIKWNEIKDWFDPDLILYIEKNVKVDKEEALKLLQETKKYLLVAQNNNTPEKSFAPSAKVDEVWHNFILFTPIYDHFCKKILKRKTLLPHIPNVGRWNKIPHNFKPGKDVNPLYINTIEAIEKEIGPIDEKYWPDPRVQGRQGTCCCTPTKMAEDVTMIGN